MKRICLISTLWFWLLNLHVQAQTLEGTVFDYDGKTPLSDVSVSLFVKDSLINIQFTDLTGFFLFHSILEKNYRLVFEKNGYKAFTRSNRWFKMNLNEILLISKTPPDYITRYNDSVSFFNTNEYLTKEKLTESLVTFEDPIRSLALAPGAILLDDRSNAISYQGLPPVFNKWYLDGFEISNPNHYQFQGGYLNTFESGGGMTSSLNNFNSISMITPGQSFSTASSVGAAFNYETGPISNYGSIGTNGMEAGLHKGRFNVGFKIGMPNAISNLGKRNGWEHSGDGSLHLNYRNVTSKKTDVMNFFYSSSYYNRLMVNVPKNIDDAYSKSYRNKTFSINKLYRYKSNEIGIGYTNEDNSYNDMYRYFYLGEQVGSSTNDNLSNRFELQYMKYINESISWGAEYKTFSLSRRDFAFGSYFDFESGIYKYVYALKTIMHFDTPTLTYDIKLLPSYYVTGVNTFAPDFSFRIRSTNKNSVSVSHNSQVFTGFSYAGEVLKSVAFNSDINLLSKKKNRTLFVKPFINYFYSFRKNRNQVFFDYSPIDIAFNSKISSILTFGTSLDYTIQLGERIRFNSNSTVTSLSYEMDDWDDRNLGVIFSNNQSLIYTKKLKRQRTLIINLTSAVVVGRNSFLILESSGIDELVYERGLSGNRYNTYRVDAGLTYKSKLGTLKLAVHNLANIKNKSYQYLNILDQEYQHSYQTGIVPFISYFFSF